jgi:hypothetical protein
MSGPGMQRWLGPGRREGALMADQQPPAAKPCSRTRLTTRGTPGAAGATSTDRPGTQARDRQSRP